MEVGKSFSCLKICSCLWLVIHLFFGCTYCETAPTYSSSTGCKELEREALIRIKRIFTTHNLNVEVGSWVGEDCCEWKGLRCDNVTGNIISFKPILKHQDQYESTNVLGLMMQALGSIAQLRYLNLSKLYMFGNNVPPQLGNLTKLEVLVLSHNGLVGEVPFSLSSLTKLKVFDLSYNDLGGEVPPPFGNLTNLEVLDLSHNRLVGEVPFSLSVLTNLKLLDLSYNGLVGEVPPSFGNLTNLEVLDLSNNDFLHIDNIRWASNLSNLQFLDLSRVNLSKAVDKTIQLLNQLPNLSHLGLSGCVLGNSHFLSNAFVNNSAILSTLAYLDLSFNNFVGPLPPDFGNFSTLNTLHLHHNFFTGSITHRWIRKLDDLKVLTLAHNTFSHIERGLIWELSHLNLDLSHNYIQDEIQFILEPPVNISRRNSCYDIQSLDLHSNHNSGNFPSLSGPFTKLKFLDLSENLLGGWIPNSLGNLTKLEHLDISSNSIQGEVSLSHLGNLSRLSNLDFSYNNLSLNLRSDWLPRFQLLRFQVASCKLTNPPQWLQTQTKIQILDLSNTGLSGELPEWISNRTSLVKLNLSHNSIAGNIPEKIGDMEALEELDLSGNKLYGKIPASLENLHMLVYLNLSNNNFSGPIPTGSFETFLNSSFTGNPYLCGEPLSKKCSIYEKYPVSRQDDDDDEDDEEENPLENMWFYLVVMLGFATGFWCFLGTLWLKQKWRHALFRCVEDVCDWVYVTVALKIIKLRKSMEKGNSQD